MEITTKKSGGVAVLQISGSLDASNLAAFKKTTQSVVSEKFFKLILDCSKLEFVDSMGLGVMISLLRRVRGEKGDLKVTGLSKDVRQVFEITRLHRLFEIFPDVEAARKSFL